MCMTSVAVSSQTLRRRPHKNWLLSILCCWCNSVHIISISAIEVRSYWLNWVHNNDVVARNLRYHLMLTKVWRLVAATLLCCGVTRVIYRLTAAADCMHVLQDWRIWLWMSCVCRVIQCKQAYCIVTDSDRIAQIDLSFAVKHQPSNQCR